jgi:hypothetical protein
MAVGVSAAVILAAGVAPGWLVWGIGQAKSLVEPSDVGEMDFRSWAN